MLLRTYNKKILLLLVVFILVSPFFVGAQDGPPDIDPNLDTGRENDYVLLEKIDGYIDDTSSKTLGGFLSGAYRLGVAVATALAVLMIVVGGVQYMGSESFFTKSDAKDRIYMALFGLILALGSFIILETINQNLVTFDIVKTLENIKEQVGIQAPDPIDILPPPSGGEEQAIRLQLAEHQILAYGPCGTSPCANLVGLGGAIQGVIGLKQACSAYAPPRICTVFITGGTEPGHRSHRPGRPILDLRKNQGLDQYIVGSASRVEQTPIGPAYLVGNDEYVNEGNHWHVCYNMLCPIEGR